MGFQEKHKLRVIFFYGMKVGLPQHKLIQFMSTNLMQ